MDDKPKTKLVSKWLPVKLPESALMEKARCAAQLKFERDETEKRKQEEVSCYSKKIKELDTEIGRLQKIVRTGEDQDNIACEERFDYAKAQVETWRLDTNEIVDRRDMHRWERQEELNLTGEAQAKAMTEAEDNHEGQQPNGDITLEQAADAAIGGGTFHEEKEGMETWGLTK